MQILHNPLHCRYTQLLDSLMCEHLSLYFETKFRCYDIKIFEFQLRFIQYVPNVYKIIIHMLRSSTLYKQTCLKCFKIFPLKAILLSFTVGYIFKS